MGNIDRVQSPPQAIAFATKLKAWCNTNGFPWWYSCAVSEHHSEEAKAKDIRDKTRAQRLGHMKLIEIDGYLGLPVPRADMPTPSRLDMMEAASHDEASPEPSSATSPPPTTSRTPDAVRYMHTDESIQRTVLAMIMTATDPEFVATCADSATAGEEALARLLKVFAPKTAAAKSTARKTYDNHIRGLTASTPLPGWWREACKLAYVMRYYEPTGKPMSDVILDAQLTITATHGEGMIITNLMNKFEEDHPSYIKNVVDRAVEMEATLVQYQNAHGVPKDQVRVFQAQAQAGQGRGLHKQAIPVAGGPASGGRPHVDNPCTWCFMYLKKAYGHDVKDCRNRTKPGLLDELRKKGLLQDDGTASVAAITTGPTTTTARACVVCMQDHDGGTANCSYLAGVQELVQKHRAMASQTSDTSASPSTTAGDLRALLAADATLASLVAHGSHHNPADRLYACTTQAAEGDRKKRKRGGVRGGHNKDGSAMLTKGEMAEGDKIIPPGQDDFKVPRHGADTRLHETKRRFHAHLATAFDALHACLETAIGTHNTDREPQPEPVPVAATTEDTDVSFTETESENLCEDDACVSLHALLGITNSPMEDLMSSDSEDSIFSVFNKSPLFYPRSFAQIDTGATHTVSSRIDIFHPPSLEPSSTVVQVADGRDIGGTVLNGVLNQTSGFNGLKGLYASNIQGTLISQPQAVREQHLAFVHTPDACFAQPYTPGKCPICTPDPRRTPFIVQDSKILLPLPPPPAQRARNAVGGADIPVFEGTGPGTQLSNFLGDGATWQNRAATHCVATQTPARRTLDFTSQPAVLDAVPIPPSPSPATLVSPPAALDAMLLPSQNALRTPTPRHKLSPRATARPGTAAALDALPIPSLDALRTPPPRRKLSTRAAIPGRPPLHAAAATQTDSMRLQQDIARKKLWHGRMPTAGCHALSKLAEKYPQVFNFDPRTKLPPCTICHHASQRKAAAPPETKRRVQPLEEVHFDLFFVHGEIILTLIDRASRFEWIYFLHKKSDLPKKLQQFLIDCNGAAFTVGSLHCDITSAKEKGIDADALNKHLAAHNLPQQVKAFYSDGAGEHASRALTAFLLGTGIQNRHSIAECQHQNGLAENMGWNTLRAARHDMVLSNMSKGFRQACLRLNIERRACTPRVVLDWQTPFEILYPNLTPPYKYFKVFGTHCTVLKQEAQLRRQGKLVARGEPGIYIGTGHQHGQSGYLVWLPHQRKQVVAEHVQFHESLFPARVDALVPDICSALPGHISALDYRSTITDPDPEPILPAIPLNTRIMSPLQPSLPPISQLSPLSLHLFNNLQSTGHIQPQPGSAHDTDDVSETTSVGDMQDTEHTQHGSITETEDTQHGSIPDTESAQDSTDEADILMNDTEAFALLTKHFIATEGAFWRGYQQPAHTPSSPFDSISSGTKRFALDLLTGDVIDAQGYVHAGENLHDSSACDSLIARALVKALKTRARGGEKNKSQHIKAIALLRNPKTVREALASPEWREWVDAIHAELTSLIEKGTFEISPTPAGRKVIPTKIVLKIKMKSNGEVEKFKARICVLGFRQKKGLDFNPDQVYSPMTEPTTIRTLLAIANKLDLNVDHLDIKTAFLNGILPPDEQFYCSPPPGLTIPSGFCWKILRGLYGAHQSGAIWAQTWRDWVHTHAPDFKEAGSERCVFVKREHADGTHVDLDTLRDITLEPGEKLIILVMNTDDLLVLYTDSALKLVDNFEALLNLSFEATPREPVDQYLGMHVTRNREQRYLSIDGRRHVRDFIHSMGFDPKASTTVRTPLDPTIVYSKEDCPAEVDVELRAKVWSAHGKLIHLAVWTRPDLAHAVSVLGRYVHNPSEKLWLAYHRIAKYLIFTQDFRLTFGTTDTEGIDGLYGYTDSDWAADLDHRKSTGAYLFLLDGASCSWKVKLSPTVCLSTQQAEYYALTEGTKEALNLRFLLRDLGFGQSLPTLLFCDNKGAITMSLHPANKPATRHIDMRIHFCRQHVEQGDVTTKFAPTPAMLADFMTKQTLRLTHERHCRRAFGDQSAPLPLEPIARVLA